jgi:hypothetical protein
MWLPKPLMAMFTLETPFPYPVTPLANLNPVSVRFKTDIGWDSILKYVLRCYKTL